MSLAECERQKLNCDVKDGQLAAEDNVLFYNFVKEELAGCYYWRSLRGNCLVAFDSIWFGVPCGISVVLLMHLALFVLWSGWQSWQQLPHC